MKIAFTSHSAELAGAERSLLSVVEVAVDRGHEIDVWVPRLGDMVAKLSVLGGGAVTVHRRPSHWWMSRRGTGVVGAVRLVQAAVDTVGFAQDFRRVRPDVVVVNTSVTPAPLLAASVLRIPTVTVVRESLLTNPTLRSVLPRSWIVACLARWSSQVVTVSRYVAEQLRPWPVGVPEPVVRSSGVRTPRSARIPRPVGGRTVRLLLLGSVGGDKGQVDVVQATAAALGRGADLRLDMYGTGVAEELARVRAAIAGSGRQDRLQLHEPVSDIGPLLADADVLVMASRNEAYGRVTVEALQAGVPVVGYRAGATTELLAEGGGLLVPASVAALADALCAVAADDALLARIRDEAVVVGNRLRSVPHDSLLMDVVETIAQKGAGQSGRSLGWRSIGPSPRPGTRPAVASTGGQ